MHVTLLVVTHRMIIASFLNSLHFQVATRVLLCTLSEKISFQNNCNFIYKQLMMIYIILCLLLLYMRKIKKWILLRIILLHQCLFCLRGEVR